MATTDKYKIEDSDTSQSYTTYQDALAKTYDTSKQNAQDVYNSAVKTNQQTANTSYQQADILNQKLAKYIPNYLKSQGINGGLSESYMAKANANMQNQYANINTALGESNQSAYETYKNALSDAESTYQSGLVTAKAEDSTLAYTDFSNALAKLYEDTSSTAEDYQALWSKYKDYLGDNSTQAQSDVNDYLAILNEADNNTITKTTTTSANDYADNKTGDITISGYKVTIQRRLDSSTDEAVLNVLNRTSANAGDAVVYGGSIYQKTSSGYWNLIGARSNGTDAYNTLKSALSNETETEVADKDETPSLSNLEASGEKYVSKSGKDHSVYYYNGQYYLVENGKVSITNSIYTNKYYTKA